MASVVRQLLAGFSDDSARAVVWAAKNGSLGDNEIAALAEGLADSGARLPRDSHSADLASTGGPTSLSTLLCPLFLRARGLRVPKLGIPGRPAGGIDVLQTIPGYRAEIDASSVQRALRKSGYVHVLADARWTPLDAEFFTYRQRVSAQEVPELVIASILAKKVAMGVVGAGLEVRVAPHGNFGKDMDRARANSQRYNAVARLMDLQPVCVLTEASSPYQPFIGRGEALLAIDDVLRGVPDPWLAAHARLCERMAKIVAGEMAINTDEPVRPADLRAVHFSLLRTHGTSPSAFNDRVETVRKSPRRLFHATRRGIPNYDLARLRELLIGRQRLEMTRGVSGTSDPAGVILLAAPNATVGRGDVLMSARVPRGEKDLADALGECVSIVTEPQAQPELIELNEFEVVNA